MNGPSPGAEGSAGDGRTYALIAGGGTAGHVLPAVAIARAIVAAGHPVASVHFVGSARGLEARLVPEAGFGITLLPGRGIMRSVAPAELAANIASVFGILTAMVRAFVLVARRRPRAVISVGGYAGFPAAFAAVVLRVPLILAESNAYAGAANRVVARFAKASAVAFPGTGLRKEVVTGNPVRPEVLAVAGASAEDRAAARTELGLPAGAVVISSFGGSLGALKINRAVLDLVHLWAGRDDVAVRHVLGRRDFASLQAELPKLPAGGLVYQAVEYEDRMPLVYAASDLFVTRSGGTTVAELAVVGVPAVLVPLPGAPGDHQTVNARSLVEAGAAVLVPDGELSGERLAAELGPIVADSARRATMAAAARAHGIPDAADRVAALVAQHAKR